ncbi:MAG: discoidin domain-containing protein [Clostridia bacterium]|nr:discoidin domain-containing protein [Clostridia bacterium]
MRKILSILMALVIVTLMFSTVSMGAGPMADDELSTDGWKMSASSVNVNQETPEKAIDGSLSSYWHSLIEPKAPAPHYIQLEMREATAISGYRYYPRKQGGAGTCTNYEVLVSLDGESFELAARGTCSNDTSPKTINFGANIVCKYVRFIMINSNAGYGAAGEVRVLAPKDTLKTREVIPGMIIHKDEISIEGMEIEASGTYHEKGIIRNPLGNLLDSNRDTYWKSSDINEEQTPHFLTIVLPKSTKVFGYRYTPRTNGEGACSAYEIWVSADGKNFNKIKEGVFGDDVNEKEIWFDAPVIAKKVKFVMKEVKGSFAMASEIRLIGEEKKADNKDAGNVEATTGELSTSGWTFITSSTNSSNGVPREKPENVIDGSAESHWHTAISPKAEGPHFITVVLPNVQKVGGYIYTPRSNMGAGTVTKYEISVSLDNVNYTKVAEGDWRHDAQVKTVEFEKSYDAKYVKLTILEGVGGFGSAAEIRLIGSTVTASSEAVQETTGEAATGELSTSGWTFITSSTNSSNGVPREKPENVIDGSAESHWHTAISPKAEGPHFITVVLPNVQKVGGYIYTPRSNMGAGTVTKYEISVSLDNVNYTKVAEGDWRHDAQVKTVEFEKSYDAKYVKLTILEGVGGFGSAAEIRLIDASAISSAGTTAEEEEKYKTALFPGTTVKSSGKSENIPQLMVDGDAGSYWHSEVKPENLPVNLDFEFSYTYTISGISYLPRQDGNFAGYFQEFYIYTSDDGENFNLVKKCSFAQINALEKEIYFDEPVKTKYLRIYLVAGNGGYGTCAELGFIQTTENYERDYKLAEEIYKLQIDSKDIYVKKNGVEKTVKTDVAPYIYEGSTMIPLRGLLAEMGAEITWISDIQRIEVKTDKSFLEFRIEDDEAFMDSVRYSMPVAPQITEGRTFIPLRFVSENLGYYVYWNGETREITITNYEQ